MKSEPIHKNVSDFSQFQVRAPVKKSSFSNYEKKVSGHNQIQNFTAYMKLPRLNTCFVLQSHNSNFGAKLIHTKILRREKKSTLKTRSLYGMETTPQTVPLTI